MFPFTINHWNGLDLDTRQITTVNHFKKNLGMSLLSKHHKLYSVFTGRAAINHTRLRLGLSALNAHRSHFNFIDFSNCPKCGAESESTAHFFFVCHAYAAQREELFTSVLTTTGLNHYIHRNQNVSRIDMIAKVKFLLHGDTHLSFEENCEIFKSVQKFITDSHRFL